MDKKTKGVQTAGPAELKAAPKRLGGAQRASGMGGGSGAVLLLLQKEVLQVFWGSVSVPVFSCKPSLRFKVQSKLLIDYQ